MMNYKCCDNLGVCNAIFNIGIYGPHEEVFSVGMLDLVLQTVSSALFTPMVATPAPYVRQIVNVIVYTVVDLADLGVVETMHTWKRVQATTWKKREGKGPINVTETQI